MQTSKKKNRLFTYDKSYIWKNKSTNRIIVPNAVFGVRLNSSYVIHFMFDITTKKSYWNSTDKNETIEIFALLFTGK